MKYLYERDGYREVKSRGWERCVVDGLMKDED